MEAKMDKIVTISRQYGSGGREIGKNIAKHFGIPFYDNELICRAAKESGYAEAAFHNAESKATNSLLYSIAMGMSAYGSQEAGFSHLSLDDRIYLAQSDVIKKCAEEGPCVIVGRCADYILKDRTDVIHFFICADMDFRKERAIRIDGVDADNAEDIVIKKDKRRANYYNYHSGEKWGMASNYHMCLNSGAIGIEAATKLFVDYLERL